MSKIAIVGYGFVGKAVEFGFRNVQNEILIIDPALGYDDIDMIEEFNPEFTFVCVPTPMGNDGSINASILKDVIKELNEIASGQSVYIQP